MKYIERFATNYYQDIAGLEPDRLFQRMEQDQLILATARRNDEIHSRLCQGVDGDDTSTEVILFDATEL